MKEIKLSPEGKKRILNLVALVDDEDYEKINKYIWHITTNKKSKTMYAATRIYCELKPKGYNVKLHRMILNISDRKTLVDHINHNGLDNRKENLRICTIQQNTFNSNKRKSISKYKGVNWVKKEKKWRTRISFNKKEIYIGRFDNEIDAALAYDNAAKKYHREFACLNFK